MFYPQSGHIYSKAMPQLALAVLDQKVTTTVAYPGSGGRTGGQAQGLIVGLKKRSSRSPEQTWIFTADGFIYAQVGTLTVLVVPITQQGSLQSVYIVVTVLRSYDVLLK